MNAIVEPTGEVVHVGPGQLYASNEAHLLRTVLGSCISVCFFDSRLHVGGMNHFLLPTAPSLGQRSVRHGDAAMEALADMLRDLGSSLRGLTAHVFGGARVLAGTPSSSDLGERNATLALDWLRRERIAVTMLDVGGSSARRIEFSLADGSASVRKLGGG